MRPVEQGWSKSRRQLYVTGILGFVFTALLLAVTIYFREEIQYLRGYGYLGVFLVGVLCGVTIIPAPTLLMVFTLGGILNPLFVGLAAGVGGALGGITVYLTGRGMSTMWSRLQVRQQPVEGEPAGRYDPGQPAQSRFWSKGQAFYHWLVKWAGGKGGGWTLFLTSAMVISPYYFAGLAAGSLRIGLVKFFLISWAGKTVRYLTIAYAGHLGLRVLLQWIGS